MAYRVIQQDLWNDEKVIDSFSAEDKYFWLYLLTNPQCNQLGIYKLPIRIAAFQLGYSVEQVVVLLERFDKALGRIKYNRDLQEIAIGNFLYHSIITGGKPVFDVVYRDMEKVEDLTMIDFVLDKLGKKNIRNKTVLEIVEALKEKSTKKEKVTKHNDNDNDNDNDNEESYHDSYHDSSKPKGKRFIKPSLTEIAEYCQEKNLNIETERFFDYYESKGWLVGKSPMKDWKATVRNWNRNQEKKPTPKSSNPFLDMLKEEAHGQNRNEEDPFGL